jgi:uncharacterized protein
MDSKYALIVSRIPESPEPFELQENGEWLTKTFGQDFYDLEFHDPVHFHGTVYRAEKNVFLKGHLSTALTVSCSRCLVTFRFPIETDCNLTILEPLPSEGDEAVIDLSESDIDVAYYHNDSIELVGILEEQIALAIPIKFLCQDECHGLCPKCGINLNDKKCDCVFEPIATKFSVLKNFKVKSSK